MSFQGITARCVLDAQLKRAFFHEVDEILQLSIYSGSERIDFRSAGSFGSVYGLTSLSNAADNHTVVKTVRADSNSTPAVLRDFLREARIWTELPHHSNVLPVYAIHNYDRRTYIRMHRVRGFKKAGCSLADLLTLGPIKLEPLLLCLLQIAGGLAFLGREVPGFAHCDIKPANLLVDKPWHWWVTDFGISRVAAQQRVASFVGDRYYVAPEVLAGSPPAQSSDIYSFGAVAYEMLTGMRLHDFGTESEDQIAGYSRFMDPRDLGRLTAVLSCKDDARNLLLYRPDVPERLFPIIHRCLEEKPQDRFGGFEELVHDLVLVARDAHMDVLASADWIESTTADTWRKRSTSAFADDPVVVYAIEHYGFSIEEALDMCFSLIRASQLRSASDFEGSDEILDRILARLRDFPPALAGKAHSLNLQRRMDEALCAYRTVREKYLEHPDLVKSDFVAYASICVSLVQVMCIRGQPDMATAKEIAQEAVELVPDSGRAWAALAGAEACNKDISSARDHYKTAHELDPGNSLIRINWEVLELASRLANAIPEETDLCTRSLVQPEEMDQVVAMAHRLVSLWAREQDGSVNTKDSD